MNEIPLPELTTEEILDILNRAAAGANELNASLEAVFSLSSESANLVLR